VEFKKNIQNLPFKTRVIIAFGAVYLIWGSTYLAIRFTVETLPPFLSAGSRFFLAGLILYAFARFKIKEPPPPKKYWKPSFISGGFLLLGCNGSIVCAERYVPSGLTALFIAIVPLWMILLEWWWHKTKRPPIVIFFGMGIGFLGVWLLMAPDFLHLSSHSIPLGWALLLLLSSFSWSIGSIYSRKVDHPKSPFLSTAMQMICGGILLLAMSFLQGEFAHFHITDCSAKSIIAWIYLIVFGSLLGFTAYIWLLKNVGVARTSTYAFVNPMVAIFLGWILAGEKLVAQTALAAFLVLIAVIVITTHHKQSKEFT